MATVGQYRLIEAARKAEVSSSDPTRHKAFISYHADDAEEVKTFVDSFGHVFIPKVIGVSDEDDFIDSSDTDYVMQRIRDKYLRDSTVTIVMIGDCTWARRYVDWEIYSTLRRDKLNRLSGLMAVTLPSVSNSSCELPPRLDDNVNADRLYARWWKYPASGDQLRQCIEDAFRARTTRAHLINNTRDRKKYSSSC
jgi:hypothetical protein